MKLWQQILLSIFGILLIGLLGFIGYKQIEIANKQKLIETSLVGQKELVDNILRSQNQYSTKEDIEKFIKENNVNLKAIKEDLDKLSAELNSVNIVTVNSKGQSSTNVPSTGTGNINPNTTNSIMDKYGYFNKEQKLSLNENFDNISVPIGQIGFSAWQEKPWSITIKPREYKLVNIIGIDENQKNYIYNKFSVRVDNQNYEVKINTSETRQEFPDAKFSLFNPRLFLTVGGGISLTQAPIQGSANVGVTLGLSSYGRYKMNPDISILQVGVGYQTGSQRPSFIVNPISFNIGNVLPKNLVNNTYIGPSLQFDTNSNVVIGGNLSIGF